MPGFFNGSGLPLSNRTKERRTAQRMQKNTLRSKVEVIGLRGSMLSQRPMQMGNSANIPGNEGSLGRITITKREREAL